MFLLHVFYFIYLLISISRHRSRHETATPGACDCHSVKTFGSRPSVIYIYIYPCLYVYIYFVLLYVLLCVRCSYFRCLSDPVQLSEFQLRVFLYYIICPFFLMFIMFIYIYIYVYIYVLFDRLLSTGQLSTPDRPVIYLLTTTSRLASQTCQLV